MAFDRRAPGDEGESKSVINHHEAAGGKVDALPIGALDWRPLDCRMIDLAGIFTYARCRFPELASPESVEEVPRENHPLTLTPGKPLRDQVLDAGAHGVADLPTEAARAQGCGPSTNKLPIKPSGTARVNLGVYWQVGANRQSHSLAPRRILKSPQLDDGARRRVTGCVKVGQAHMVGASIHAVDHGVGCPLELVVETARDQPPDERPHGVPVIECKVADAAFNALVSQSAVDAPDDVVTLSKRPHHRFGFLRQVPPRWTERLGEAKALQFVHAADHGGTSVSIRPDIGAWPQVHDTVMLRRLADERTVERGPPVGLDLGLEIMADLEVASQPELSRGEMRGASAQAVADVVTVNH